LITQTEFMQDPEQQSWWYEQGESSEKHPLPCCGLGACTSGACMLAAPGDSAFVWPHAQPPSATSTTGARTRLESFMVQLLS
jgi:hypothetical protein